MLKRKRNRSDQLKIIEENDSGVENFPMITNYKNHFLICVLAVKNFEKYLKIVGQLINSNEQNQKVEVLVKDFWRDSNFSIGTKLRLISPLIISDTVFEVSGQTGLLITDPETLLSCTTMASILFCSRKALFSERFRGACTSFPMLLGTVVHELFQKCVLKKPKVLTSNYLFNEYRINYLPNVCIELVALGEKLNRFESELRNYLTTVCQWIKKYIPETKSNKLESNKQSFIKNGSVCFNKLIDIEDNVWSPTIGIKGKIDISFQESNSMDVLPLELKTGKPHIMEHLSQVMLYSLAYSETKNKGKIVPGYLLYMKDGTTRELRPKSAELKGILQMRNRMVPYFTRICSDSFPEPLKNSKLCSWCDHSTTCGIFHKYYSQNDFLNFEITINENEKENEYNKSLFKYETSAEMNQFLSEKVAHLNEKDFKYFKYFVDKIFSDWSAAKNLSPNFLLFSDAPEIREEKGKCIANLRLEFCTNLENTECLLIRFIKAERKKIGEIPFKVGDMVVISSEKAYAVFLESIFAIDEFSITILLKKLIIPNNAKEEIYFMDKYESLTSFSILLGNLSQLMENNEQSNKIRSLIIQKRKPLFRKLSKPEIMIFLPIKNELSKSKLKNQALAVLKALMAEDYALIDGVFDKGRRNTLIALIRCLVLMGKTLLLTSLSNSTLDVLIKELLKHFDKEKILRIGSSNRSSALNIDDSDLFMQELYLNSKLAKFKNNKSDEFFQNTFNVLMKTPIVVTTCSRVSTHSLFTKRIFDFCLVDDSECISEPILIRLFLQANCFVLFGDLNKSEMSEEKTNYTTNNLTMFV